MKLKFGLDGRKIVAITMAVTILVVSSVMSTYAWTDYRQHKTNELSGATDKFYDVTLIEDFMPKSDWQTGDQAIKKEVRVTNPNTANFAKGSVFVRLTFKEYMEIATQTDFKATVERYAVGTDGRYLVLEPGATENEIRVWLSQQGYAEHSVQLLEDALTGERGYYIQTQAGDINGQYGKHVITGAGTGGSAIPLIPGTSRASSAASNAHSDDSNAECAYPAYNLSNSAVGRTAPIHKYVNWNLSAQTKPLSIWSGETGVWVYNDLDPNDLYVYWIGALRHGDTTANSLESLKLTEQPNGAFYYAVHVDLEAISLDELAGWEDAPAEIKTALGGLVTP